MSEPEPDATRRLVAVKLDEASIGRGTPDQEHERRIAIYDLLEENCFSLPERPGPYELAISLQDAKLVLDVATRLDGAGMTHILSLTPFRRILKDYFAVCETYYAAIRTATPTQIEAIDMGRRGLHNDGASLLADRLAGKIDLDLDTSRRLFTLLTALHWRG
jgi:uncharacterized protein (UPF0262 family)